MTGGRGGGIKVSFFSSSFFFNCQIVFYSVEAKQIRVLNMSTCFVLLSLRLTHRIYQSFSTQSVMTIKNAFFKFKNALPTHPTLVHSDNQQPIEPVINPRTNWPPKALNILNVRPYYTYSVKLTHRTSESLVYVFPSVRFKRSPWYDRIGWLGVKHQVTVYLFVLSELAFGRLP